jgi:hypothetical protein
MDVAAGWPEHGGGQGGGGQRPAWQLLSHPVEYLAKDQERAGVDASQQGGDQRVAEGAADDSVDVVKA